MARKRTGNPSKEIHNDTGMTCIDWFAPAGTKPEDIPGLIQNALPSLKVLRPIGSPSPFTVNGYVNTSVRPDGSVYVCLHLFSQAYSDNPDTPIVAAPNVPPGQIQQIVAACGGEHGNAKRKIDGSNKQKDKDNLKDAGFKDNDAPLLDN